MRVVLLLHVGLVVFVVGPRSVLFDAVFFQPVVEVLVQNPPPVSLQCATVQPVSLESQLCESASTTLAGLGGGIILPAPTVKPHSSRSMLATLILASWARISTRAIQIPCPERQHVLHPFPAGI